MNDSPKPKNSKMGRPKGSISQASKYKPKFCKEILQYFDKKKIEEKRTTKINRSKTSSTECYEVVGIPPPLIEGFARKVGVSSRTLRNWTKKHKHFKDAYEKALDMQRVILIQNALRGQYNPYFMKIAAINLMAWKDGAKDVTSTIKRDVEKIPDKELKDQIDKKLANQLQFRKTGTA